MLVEALQITDLYMLVLIVQVLQVDACAAVAPLECKKPGDGSFTVAATVVCNACLVKVVASFELMQPASAGTALHAVSVNCTFHCARSQFATCCHRAVLLHHQHGSPATVTAPSHLHPSICTGTPICQCCAAAMMLCFG